jgi:RNA polymerase sigma-70 factor (family 1)
LYIKLSNIDISLVKNLKKGDKRAFEKIFYKYKERIYFFAFGYLKNEAETEEIVQNTFVSLWERRFLLKEDLPIKSYIFKIAVNSIYNILKHKAVHKKFIDYISNSDSKIANIPEHDLEYKELLKMLDVLIEDLPEKQKMIFILSRREGLTHSEIARKLGLSERTVENQVYRAIKYIKSNLEEEYSI